MRGVCGKISSKMNLDQHPRAEAVIDLNALRHNVALLADRAPHSDFMAVVKADGYGHGAEAIARAALEAGAGWLGPCSVGDASDGGWGGITGCLFSGLDGPEVDFPRGIENNVDLSASSLRELTRMAAAAKKRGRPPKRKSTRQNSSHMS